MIGRRTFNRLLALLPFGLSACGSREEPKPAATAAPSSPAETASPSLDAGNAPPATARAGAIRFLALGDSYTIGESVPVNERWPVQLAAHLREVGLDVTDPEIIARTGWRTDNLDAAISRAKPQGPYQLVSLLIGVNNQYQGRPVDDYRREFPALLRRAIDFAGGDAKRVLVLSIPDYGATPFGQADADRIGRELDAYNAISRVESERAGVRYVDITPGSRLAREQPDLIAGDGLHPSGKMYADWVKLALPAAEAALASDVDKQP